MDGAGRRLWRRPDGSDPESEMTMEMRLFNTLTGQVEPLEPLAPPEVRMYACGLTVYNRGHVGNYRTMVISDVLRRTLRHLGYRVNGVLNITDVDDRIIQQAVAAGSDIQGFTAEYIRGPRRGHGDPRARASRAHAPGHRPHPRDDRAHRAPDRERPHLRGRRQRLLPDRVLSRVRTALGARRGGDQGRGPGRHRQVRQGERPGLRPVEAQDRRAGVGPVGRPLRARVVPAGTSSARP